MKMYPLEVTESGKRIEIRQEFSPDEVDVVFLSREQALILAEHLVELVNAHKAGNTDV